MNFKPPVEGGFFLALGRNDTLAVANHGLDTAE